MNPKQQIALNFKVLDVLRQHARLANNGELLEISQTIQLIRYDNERLFKQLIAKGTVWTRMIRVWNWLTLPLS